MTLLTELCVREWGCGGLSNLFGYKLTCNYCISLIISRTFLHETPHPKNGVRLTIEMRLTFEIFLKLTVRHAYA